MLRFSDHPLSRCGVGSEELVCDSLQGTLASFSPSTDPRNTIHTTPKNPGWFHRRVLNLEIFEHTQTCCHSLQIVTPTKYSHWCSSISKLTSKASALSLFPKLSEKFWSSSVFSHSIVSWYSLANNPNPRERMKLHKRVILGSSSVCMNFLEIIAISTMCGWNGSGSVPYCSLTSQWSNVSIWLVDCHFIWYFEQLSLGS